MKKKRILALIGMLAIVLTACQGTGNKKEDTKAAISGTADKDMVTINITSEPLDLNPMLITDATSQSVLAHCMSGFTRLDENNSPVADLAESWEISEDNTVYTMHLKEGIKWSNGDPVTASDFYYSWVTQMNPETGAVFANYLFENIKNGQSFYDGETGETDLGLKVVDDNTLRIEWSHSMNESRGLFYLSQPFYFPINQKAYEEIGGEDYAKDADKMVTNGAYEIVEWTHDSQIIMEKSKNYYGEDEIKIPKVKLVMIGDANAGVNAFVTGEIDLCNLYSEQIAQIEKKSEKAIQSYADGGTWYINFNTKDENVSNINLRKALSYSLDIQSLLDNVINDGSVAADGLVPPVVKGVDSTSYTEARGSLFAYDKEKAAKCLELALQELGKNKEELKLTFSVTDTTYNQNQAAYLQQQWKENLGLDVELEIMTVKALSEAQYNGEYTFLVDGWGPTENDAITFLENYTTDNANNTGGYTNTAYDTLIEESERETDAGKRQELLIQAEKILMEDMAVGPLYFTRTTYAISEKLDGIVRTPFQFFNVRYAEIVK